MKTVMWVIIAGVLLLIGFIILILNSKLMSHWNGNNILILSRHFTVVVYCLYFIRNVFTVWPLEEYRQMNIIKFSGIVTEKDGSTITLLKFNRQWLAVTQKDKQIIGLKIMNSAAISEVFNLNVNKFVWH